MTRYAHGTTVSTEKTRVEIEETLRRFGADAFASGYEARTAFIKFRARGRFVLLRLTLPATDDKAFTRSPTGKPRSPGTATEAYEAECRRRWRSLALLVKAKLAAVQDGIVTFEEEWLPHVVLPSGKTVYQEAAPAVALAYETGGTPLMLPDYTGKV